MSWNRSNGEQDSAFELAGRPTINVLLRNAFSEHNFLRLFQMYWKLSGRISRVSLGDDWRERVEGKGATLFPREREAYSHRRWLDTWFGTSKQGIEGVAKALDSLIRFSRDSPGFNIYYAPTRAHKYILEIAVKVVYGCGFTGCTLSQLSTAILGGADTFFRAEIVEEFEWWPKEGEWGSFLEALLLKNSSQIPGESIFFCKFGDPSVYVVTELVNSGELGEDDILFSECCAKASPLHLAAMCGDFSAFRNFLGIEDGTVDLPQDFEPMCDLGALDMFGNSVAHIIIATFGDTSTAASHAMIKTFSALASLVNERNKMGISPLQVAASGGNALAIEALLDFGATAETGALKLAALANSEACVTLLLQNGTNPVDVENEMLTNPNIRPNIVEVARKWLLQRVSWPHSSSADRVKLWTVDARSVSEFTSVDNISMEFSKMHGTVKPRLISHPTSTDKFSKSRSTLRSIARQRDIGLLAECLSLSNKHKLTNQETVTESPPVGKSSKGILLQQKVRQSYEIFLRAAIANNDVSAARAAIVRGASISELEHSCLEMGKLEAANLIGGEDFAVRDLASAVANSMGSENAFETISNVSVDPTSKYWMPLHASVATGSEEMVRLLLAFGARVNLPNLFGRRPLHFLNSMSSRRDVELLGRRRTYRSRTLSEQDIKDFVAEEEEVKIRETEIRDEALRTGQALLDLGADACLPDKYGWRPLHMAVYKGDYVFAKLLLMYGANFTECCGGLEQEFVHAGLSALHIAVVQKHITILGFMLFTPAIAGVATAWMSRGSGAICTIDPLDKYGRTPMFYAAAAYDATTLAILANAGGDLNTEDESGARMIQNIKADYETSTGKWGLWLLELLISNGTQLQDEEIEIDSARYDAAVEVHIKRKEKLQVMRRRSSSKAKGSLIFWADPAISPPCFLCGSGRLDKEESVISQFHCFCCGLVVCGHCSYRSSPGRAFPETVTTKSGDVFTSCVCLSCALLTH